MHVARSHLASPLEGVTGMGLNEQLMADLKDAMRNRQEIRLSTIRMLRAGIANEAIEKRRPLDDGEIIGIISRQIKQRRESIGAFLQGNRPELAAREQEELEILQSYMPAQMSREEIAEAVRAAIREVDASGPGDFGRVMAVLAPRLKGRAEGREIAEIARESLAAPE
jgi:uncharacterized protein